jgi:DHA1 family inner membrane transport protein
MRFKDPMKSSTALLALATGAFAIGTTEFTPMGLLPVIAHGVDVSIPTAGMLVSAYAIGVMVGAPVMTLLFSRFGKRAALISLMLIFTVGNLLSACAPGYTTLLLSRLITSLNHGAFFGIGAVVEAGDLAYDLRRHCPAGPGDHRRAVAGLAQG